MDNKISIKDYVWMVTEQMAGMQAPGYVPNQPQLAKEAIIAADALLTALGKHLNVALFPAGHPQYGIDPNNKMEIQQDIKPWMSFSELNARVKFNAQLEEQARLGRILTDEEKKKFDKYFENAQKK